MRILVLGMNPTKARIDGKPACRQNEDLLAAMKGLHYASELEALYLSASFLQYLSRSARAAATHFFAMGQEWILAESARTGNTSAAQDVIKMPRTQTVFGDPVWRAGQERYYYFKGTLRGKLRTKPKVK